MLLNRSICISVKSNKDNWWKNYRWKKMQYDINGAAVKVSILSSRKKDQNEYLTDEERFPPDQRTIIEQSKFA